MWFAFFVGLAVGVLVGLIIAGVMDPPKGKVEND